MQRSSKAWSPPRSDIPLREAFYDVIKKIREKNFKKFARVALQIDEDELAEIEADNSSNAKERKYKMLEKWEEQQGSNASVDLLYATLNHFLFPDECPKPNACEKDSKEVKKERYTADAVGFNDAPVQEMDRLRLESRNNSLSVDHCSQVTKITIEPCEPQFFERNNILESTYDSQNCGGSVLLINNMFAHDTVLYRKGSECDVRNMEELWKGFGCIVHVEKDLFANDFPTVLRRFCKESEYYDYCVVFIMSHGGEDGVLGSDERVISYKEIVEPFDNKNAAHLQGIPKLFFFQCCRGAEPDVGVPVHSKEVQQQKANEGKTTSEFHPIGDKVPTVCDRLISFPTQHGNQAFRHTENGSWFINAIANIFMRHAKDEHVLDLMIKVNDAISKKSSLVDGQEVKQMSDVNNTLRRKLYLYPGRK